MRLIPRPVYVEMVKAHQQRVEIIEKVFDELFWLWDLNERQRTAEAEGRTVSRAELAQEVMAEMDDADWWKATAAFEDDLITGFSDDMERWTEYLDPVYDLQEAEGWRKRQ
ncbi:MAG: hypothetical protein M3173_01170 [Chloroflexota bacterium]|nr:hypothetical protein [Chloroflexota bacterium]